MRHSSIFPEFDVRAPMPKRPVKPEVKPFHPNLTDELSDWVVSLQRTEEALVAEVKRLEKRESELLFSFWCMTLSAILLVAFICLL